MVRMTVIATVREEKKEEFLQAVRSLQRDRVREPGAREAGVYEDGDRTRFRLVEEWETQAHLERHRESENFRVLQGALKALCVEADLRWGRGPDEGG
ncbi:MAG: antibiotic biosynthesis monooxygenase [Deferrisomatales bacterium]|nr:antibiotic biosynthesis monooxygenase [Deferrisomatales bacterium]